MNSFQKTVAVMLFAGVVTAALVSCGNNNKNDNTEVIYTGNHSKSIANKSCSEEGLFYMGNDQLLHYVSAESGEDIIYCFDPTCKHEPVSSANPDPECMAAGYADRTKMLYHDGAIYIFAGGPFEHTIYKMDISTGTREVIAEFPFSYSTSYTVFDEEYVYYAAVENEEIENSVSLKSTTHLMRVNLKDGTYSLLTEGVEEKGKSLGSFDVCGDTAFVMMSGERHFYVIDVETGEVKLELNNEEYTDFGKSFLGVHNNESYYYISDDGDAIGIYNIRTEESKIIIEIDSEKDYMSLYEASCGKIFYRVTDRNTSEFEVFLYSVADDKRWNITEKYEELNISSYDAYKGKFITLVYDEKGEVIVRHSVVDEAEVLGTR